MKSLIASTFFTYQNIKLLPTFRKVHLAIKIVAVSNVNKSKILKNQTNIWNARRSERISAYINILILLYLTSRRIIWIDALVSYENENLR